MWPTSASWRLIITFLFQTWKCSPSNFFNLLKLWSMSKARKFSIYKIKLWDCCYRSVIFSMKNWFIQHFEEGAKDFITATTNSTNSFWFDQNCFRSERVVSGRIENRMDRMMKWPTGMNDHRRSKLDLPHTNSFQEPASSTVNFETLCSSDYSDGANSCAKRRRRTISPLLNSLKFVRNCYELFVTEREREERSLYRPAL